MRNLIFAQELLHAVFGRFREASKCSVREGGSGHDLCDDQTVPDLQTATDQTTAYR